jgi:hypothetical protein
MIRRLLAFVLVLAAALTPAMAWSQEPSSVDKPTPVKALPGSALGDSSGVFVSGSGGDVLDVPFRTNTERPLSMYLARNTRLMFGYETYKLSRLECTFEGVGMGMTMGMAVGALGMTAGVWDEGTSWYLAGAMAALGALIGGTVKADDPGWSLRVRWDPDQ